MLDGSLEQLHYTWTPRGVEGINRFQIAAISPGLKTGSMAPLLPAIRKICRYDRPKGGSDELPVSFGWLDHRDHRIAFCRVGLPRTEGRRGSFAAHVVVGRPDQLSEADVASTFGSPFWWTGLSVEEAAAIEAGGQDFDLPRVALEEMLANRVEPGGDDLTPVLTLAGGLLTLPTGKRLAVLDRREEFGPALRALSRQLPEALEGISLSTYEGAATFPFRVTGAMRPQPRLQQCDLSSQDGFDPDSRQTLESLVSADPRHDRLRTAARKSAPLGGAQRGEALWEAASRIVALRDGESTVDGASLQVLGVPEAVAYIAEGELGRANLAEAARRGSPGVLKALGVASRQLSPAERDALCAALGEQYVTTGELGGCAGLAAVLPDGPEREAMLDQIVDAALAEESAARSLEAEDAILVLTRVSARGVAATAAGELLRGAERHLVRCASEQELPTPYLTAMFRNVLRDSGDAAALAYALGARPTILAMAALDEGEKECAVSVLERLPLGRLEGSLPGLLPSLADADRKPRLDAALGRLPGGSAGRCIASAAALSNAQGREMPPVLSQLCDEHAASLLVHGSAPLALELLACSRSQDHPLAERLLRGAIRQRSGESASVSVRRALDIRDDDLRSAIVLILLDRAVEVARLLDDVGDVWAALADAYPGATDSEMLGRLLEHGLRRPGAMGGGILLAWIARALLPMHPKLLGRGGRLRDREVDERARRVVAGVPQWRLAEMETYVAGADRRSLAWWDGLEAHRKKLAKRRRRAGA